MSTINFQLYHFAIKSKIDSKTIRVVLWGVYTYFEEHFISHNLLKSRPTTTKYLTQRCEVKLCYDWNVSYNIATPTNIGPITPTF